MAVLRALEKCCLVLVVCSSRLRNSPPSGEARAEELARGVHVNFQSLQGCATSDRNTPSVR
jgi:hypothetical protein